MENIKPAFSKQELMDELRCVLVTFAHEIGRVYQYTLSYRLLGLESSEIDNEDYADPFYENKTPLNSIDIDRFWITPTISQLYDYAFSGILHPDLDWSVVNDDIKGFFDGLYDFPLLENNLLHMGNMTLYSINYCTHVIALSIARAYLNGDSEIAEYTNDLNKPSGCLTLTQMALLANIDEKTVRNLAGPKSKQPLKTISVNNRTYVELEVARDWLNDRGQLIETVMIKDVNRDLSTHGFTSVTDISSFIRDTREKLQLSIEQLAEIASLDVSTIKDAEDGSLQFNPKTFVQIGKGLGLNQRDFAKAALKTFQSAQLTIMEREIENLI